MREQPLEPMITRRTAMRQGALAGGALLWTVPAVQVMSTHMASADTASGPTPTPTPSTSVLPTKIVRTPTPETSVEGTKTSTGGTSASGLPATGIAFSVLGAAGVGGALVAGGAAIRRYAAAGSDGAHVTPEVTDDDTA